MSVIQVINNNWNFNDVIEDKSEVVQNVNTRLSEFKQDCFFDLDAGIDWINYIGSDETAINTIQPEILRIINNTRDVISVENIDIKFDNNNLTIKYSILTRFGSVDAVYNI